MAEIVVSAQHSPMAHGAVGDGAADDTAIFAEMIAGIGSERGFILVDRPYRLNSIAIQAAALPPVKGFSAWHMIAPAPALWSRTRRAGCYLMWAITWSSTQVGRSSPINKIAPEGKPPALFAT